MFAVRVRTAARVDLAGRIVPAACAVLTFSPFHNDGGSFLAVSFPSWPGEHDRWWEPHGFLCGAEKRNKGKRRPFSVSHTTAMAARRPLSLEKAFLINPGFMGDSFFGTENCRKRRGGRKARLFRCPDKSTFLRFGQKTEERPNAQGILGSSLWRKASWPLFSGMQRKTATGDAQRQREGARKRNMGRVRARMASFVWCRRCGRGKGIQEREKTRTTRFRRRDGERGNPEALHRLSCCPTKMTPFAIVSLFGWATVGEVLLCAAPRRPGQRGDSPGVPPSCLTQARRFFDNVAVAMCVCRRAFFAPPPSLRGLGQCRDGRAGAGSDWPTLAIPADKERVSLVRGRVCWPPPPRSAATMGTRRKRTRVRVRREGKGDCAASAPKRQRTCRRDGFQDQVGHSVLEDLPNEVLWAIIVFCGQRDVEMLGSTSRRMQRMCRDESLWARLYDRDVPPCSGECLSLLGADIARSPEKPLDYARRRLDRLLDKERQTVDDTDAVCPGARWDVSRLANAGADLADCPHHWPSVLEARGYRWACMSMRPLPTRPRRRCHHGDRVVGTFRIDNLDDPTSGGLVYRGDATVVGTPPRHHYNPNGMGTRTGVARQAGDVWEDRPVAVCASGRWHTGHPWGPHVGWYRAADGPERGLTMCFHQCTDEPPLATDIGAAADNNGDDREPSNGARLFVTLSEHMVAVGTCHKPYIIQKRIRGRVWHTIVDHASGDRRPIRGVGVWIDTDGPHGITADPSGAQGLGIVRTPSGRMAFVGRLTRGVPSSGRLLDRAGATLYDGDLTSDGAPCYEGTFYLADGVSAWSEYWPHDRGCKDPDDPAPRASEVIVTYPGGARACVGDVDRTRGRGRPPQVLWFSWEGSSDADRLWPSAMWEAVRPPFAHRAARAGPPPVPLLVDAGLCSGSSPYFTHRDEIVEDLIFWPVPNAPDHDRPHLADTIEFVERMAAARPRWERYVAIVAAFYRP